jgi:hypothetical protein
MALRRHGPQVPTTQNDPGLCSCHCQLARSHLHQPVPDRSSTSPERLPTQRAPPPRRSAELHHSGTRSRAPIMRLREILQDESQERWRRVTRQRDLLRDSAADSQRHSQNRLDGTSWCDRTMKRIPSCHSRIQARGLVTVRDGPNSLVLVRHEDSRE